MMSPAQFTTRPTTPSRYPQRLPVKKPYAHAAHARHTTLSSSGAQGPIREKESRAFGFSLQIGSSGPPGVSSEIAESPLASTPSRNRHESAVTPAGLVIARNLQVARSRLTGGASAASEEPKAMSESAARAC